MKVKYLTTTTITICYLFSVFVLTESRTYILNYDNSFDGIFPQITDYDFKLYKYKDIDTKLNSTYVGPNTGGAFSMVDPPRWKVPCSTERVFNGYVTKFTMSYYCTQDDLLTYMISSCPDIVSYKWCTETGWTYNHTIDLGKCLLTTKVSNVPDQIRIQNSWDFPRDFLGFSPTPPLPPLSFKVTIFFSSENI